MLEFCVLFIADGLPGCDKLRRLQAPSAQRKSPGPFNVRKSELEHVITAAQEITGEREFVVIGSQALHGAFPNLVDKLVTSHECDI